MFNSTLSLISALDGCDWSAPRPGHFSTGKETHYELFRRLGGHKGRSGSASKIPLPPGLDPQTAQPIASCYTGCAIPAHDESSRL